MFSGSYEFVAAAAAAAETQAPHLWVCVMSPIQNKDVYLLDDPLAAVDTDVAEHLMKKCVVQLLQGKTRILCTHRLEFVDQADTVVLMEEGTIVRTGRKH